MSVQAITWVLEDAPDVPPRLVAPLLALANHADRNGCGAAPGAALLGWYTRKDRRNARKDIDDLLKLGLIREGDQRIVGHLRADKRPVVYDLAVERKRDREPTDGGTPASPRNRKSEEANGGTPASPRKAVRGDARIPRTNRARGDAERTYGGMPASPIPSTEPSTSSSSAPSTPEARIAVALGIEEEEAQKVFNRIVVERRPAAPSRYIDRLIETGDIRQFRTVARIAPAYSGPRCEFVTPTDGTGLCARCHMPAAHAKHGDAA